MWLEFPYIGCLHIILKLDGYECSALFSVSDKSSELSIFCDWMLCIFHFEVTNVCKVMGLLSWQGWNMCLTDCETLECVVYVLQYLQWYCSIHIMWFNHHGRLFMLIFWNYYAWKFLPFRFFNCLHSSSNFLSQVQI